MASIYWANAARRILSKNIFQSGWGVPPSSYPVARLEKLNVAVRRGRWINETENTIVGAMFRKKSVLQSADEKEYKEEETWEKKNKKSEWRSFRMLPINVNKPTSHLVIHKSAYELWEYLNDELMLTIDYP